MTKPEGATAPALPDTKTHKEVKGKLMRKKSENIYNAEAARKESMDVREKWNKTVKKGKGKGKGKGKDKGKGKGKGKGWVKKRTSIEEAAAEKDSEKVMAQLDRIDKQVEIKVRKSIQSELPPKPIKLKEPKFVKISSINPDGKGLNIYAKVMKEAVVVNDTISHVTVGDETGVVTLSVRPENPMTKRIEVGKVMRIQNTHVVMIKGFVNLDMDKWSMVKVEGEIDGDVKESNNVSAVEYELS